MSAHSTMPGPKTASPSDQRRWSEVVELAEGPVASEPLVARSSDTKTTSAVSSTRQAIPAGLNEARQKNATPWTGEADCEAPDASSVVDSAPSDAEVAARSLLPDRPWGNQRLRLVFWPVASAILVVAAIVLSDVASGPVGLAAIVAVLRTLHVIYLSRLERRIARTPRTAHNREDKPPKSRSDGPTSGEASGGGPAPQSENR